MLNATIRNGELNPALLYLNKSELAVYHLIEKLRKILVKKLLTNLTYLQEQ